MGARQLSLVRPTRRQDAQRMSERQRILMRALRAHGQISTHQAASLCGYQDASAALRRLVGRGMARRVARGVYRPVRVGEARSRPLS